MGRTVGWFFLPLLTGVLLLAAFPPWGLFPLAWVAPVPLAIHALKEPKRWRRWGAQVLGGYATMVAAFFWTRHNTPIGPWAMALYLGLYFPLFGGLLRLMVGGARIPPAAALPAAWVTCDYLRGTLFTGLPYYLLGHSQIPVLPLCQAADLGGVHLVGFLVLGAAGTVAAWALKAAQIGGRAAWRARPVVISAIVTAGLLGAAVGYGLWRLATLRLIDGPRIGLVQPNIPQDVHEISRLYRDPGRIHAKVWWATDRLLEQARGAEPVLVVWPESAWLAPVVLSPNWSAETSLHDPIMGLRRAPTYLLFGCERLEPGPGVELRRADAYVSAVLLRGDGKVLGHYDKQHLVPFGEYVPLKDMELARQIYQEWSNMAGAPRFLPGRRSTLLRMDGHRFGVTICYEAIFPEIARAQTAAGAEFIVNVSNEGWFKDGAELPLMWDICRFRAIENRRAFVRATNTGVSGFILPTGREDVRMADNVEGALARTVRTAEGETVYGKIGEAFPAGCAGFVGLAAAVGAVRRWRSSRN
jgi:apolipoprotein N-acyltransferase